MIAGGTLSRLPAFCATIAGVDGTFGMGRTAVHITGDASCAVIASAAEARKKKA